MSEVKVTYHGHSMFGINSPDGTKIITDPYNEKIKSVLPDVSANIVLSSHDHFDHNNIAIVRDDPVLINKQGKTEISGIKIEGIPSFHDTKKGQLRGKNIIFKFMVDKIIFSHMGDLGHLPDEDTYNKLSDVDILLIPVGGIYTINAQEATDIAKIIKPAVIIPMHYRETDSKLEVDTVSSFLNKWNAYKKKGHTFTIEKTELPRETEIWLMESS